MIAVKELFGLQHLLPSEMSGAVHTSQLQKLSDSPALGQVLGFLSQRQLKKEYCAEANGAMEKGYNKASNLSD